MANTAQKVSDNEAAAKLAALGQAMANANAQRPADAQPQNTGNLGTAQVQPNATTQPVPQTAAPQSAPQPAVPQQTPPATQQQGGYSYDKGTDYTQLINAAVAAGNYQLAAIYEQQRNAKIAGEGMGYQPTNQYGSYLPAGVVSTQTTTKGPVQDLSPMINQLYDQTQQQIKQNVAYETQEAVDQLNRALKDAQPMYSEAIAQQILATKQAQDAQALYNQVQGDRGGIGSAQISSIGNAGMRTRQEIAAEQRKLATDTVRQIADLRAQGAYEEANQLLQNTQARLAALYDEQVRLQNYEQTRTSTLAALGENYMSAGLMPSDDMLAALGIDAATAQRYIDLVQQQMAATRYSGSGGGGGSYAGKVLEQKDAVALGERFRSGGLAAIEADLAYLEAQGYNVDQLIDWIWAYYQPGSDGADVLAYEQSEAIDPTKPSYYDKFLTQNKGNVFEHVDMTK